LAGVDLGTRLRRNRNDRVQAGRLQAILELLLDVAQTRRLLRARRLVHAVVVLEADAKDDDLAALRKLQRWRGERAACGGRKAQRKGARNPLLDTPRTIWISKHGLLRSNN